MAAKNWTTWIGEAGPTKQLLEAGAAAGELAQHRRVSGKEKLGFATVAEIVLIGTAVIGAASESVHLWKELRHRQHGNPKGRTTDAAAPTRSSPHHRGEHAAVGDAESERHHNRIAILAGRHR